MKSFLSILLLVSAVNLIAYSEEAKGESVSPFVGNWVRSSNLERFVARPHWGACGSLSHLNSISSAGLLIEKIFIDGKVRNIRSIIVTADGHLVLDEALYRASLLVGHSEELKQLTVEQRTQVDQELATVTKTAVDQFNGQKLKFSLSEDAKTMVLSRGDGVDSSKTSIGPEGEFTKVDDSTFKDIVDLHATYCH